MERGLNFFFLDERLLIYIVFLLLHKNYIITFKEDMHPFGNVPAVLIHIKMTTIFLTWCFYSYYYERVTLTEERF